MKIRGRTVGTTMPRPDWSQKDPRKANYILNKPDGIVCDVSGSVVSVCDSSNQKLHNLTLYGKTTQDGTPTPETPVEIVSVGENGAINTTVCGKNIVDVFNEKMNIERTGANADRSNYGHREYLNKVADDGIITIDINGASTYGLGFKKNLKKGQTVTISFDVLNLGNGTGIALSVYDTNNHTEYRKRSNFTTPGRKNVVFTADADSTYQFGWFVGSGTMPCGAKISNLQMEFGSVATDYEPYKTAQTLTTSTPNGLPGIPVSSGGNYTDENGQQWICDYKDYSCGVYVQRIGKLIMNGTNVIFNTRSGSTQTNMFFVYADDIDLPDYSESKTYPILCSHGTSIPHNVAYKGTVGAAAYKSTASTSLRFSFGLTAEIDTTDKANTWLADQYNNGTPLTFLYVLSEPIETPLSADELSAFAALHTNKPNTTVYNDAGAGLKLAYNADAKTYIDNKFAELQNAILSAGANV